MEQEPNCASLDKVCCGPIAQRVGAISLEAHESLAGRVMAWRSQNEARTGTVSSGSHQRRAGDRCRSSTQTLANLRKLDFDRYAISMRSIARASPFRSLPAARRPGGRPCLASAINHRVGPAAPARCTHSTSAHLRVAPDDWAPEVGVDYQRALVLPHRAGPLAGSPQRARPDQPAMKSVADTTRSAIKKNDRYDRDERNEVREHLCQPRDVCWRIDTAGRAIQRANLALDVLQKVNRPLG